MQERQWCLWLAACAVLALAMTGCAPSSGGGGSDENVNDNQDVNTNGDVDTNGEEFVLTEDEEDAISDCVDATEAIVVTTDTVETGIPDAEDISTVGTCPAIELGEISLASAEVTLDFGSNGCTPTWAPEETCSGQVTMVVNIVAKTAQAEFESLTCNGDSLDGTVDITSYERTETDVTLECQWAVAFTTDDGAVATEGVGTVKYNLETYVVTIVAFDGTVTEGDDTWNLTVENLAVSYADYGSYVPYQGVMSISGPDIRTLWIRFNENSPETFEVEVGLSENGPWVTMSLEELFE